MKREILILFKNAPTFESLRYLEWKKEISTVWIELGALCSQQAISASDAGMPAPRTIIHACKQTHFRA
jgi:hypothetical protein